MIRYLKNAFLYHWNLLFVAAGTVFGFISGRPDVVLPLVGAGEVVYLAGLASHPRFQKAVDARALAKARPGQVENSGEDLERILTALDRADRTRFVELRDLCRKLNAIGREVQGVTEDPDDPATRLQQQALNRLLWVWLKILYAKNALEQYFETVNEKAVRQKIAEVEKRLADMDREQAEEQQRAKYRKSLSDTLSAYEKRLATMESARANLEFLEIELERLHTKIASLAEMGVSGHDPDEISTEIDVVSQSAEGAEKLMSELEVFSGFAERTDAPPALLTRELALSVQNGRKRT
ncbi:MAG: hypothetical protein AB1921_12115 [Thermodesulfobacteriota bacterium]